MPPASPLSLSPLVERVRSALADQEIYLIGGAVRDALLGRLSHDLDFAVPQNAIPLARRVANILNADFYILDEAFDTARVIVSATERADQSGEGRDVLDFSSFRGPTLESDLHGRDFTINAIAYDLGPGVLLDPLNGASDLRARIIRACSRDALDADPIRILRAVRLAAAFDFKVEAGTREAMKRAVGGLPAISPERQRDELFKILEGPRPDASLRAMEILGVFPYLLPELSQLKGVEQSPPHVSDVWEHTLSVLQHQEGILAALALDYVAENTNDLLTGLLTLRLGRYREQFAQHFARRLNMDRSMRALLFFAALYHDVSKSATKTIDETGRIRFLGHDEQGATIAGERAAAFNLSNDEIARLETVIANHMRFHFHVSRMEGEQKPPSRKAIYRFFRDTSEAGVDLVLLGLADLRGTRGSTLTAETWGVALDIARILLENYWEKPEETVAPPRLIDGNDLIQEFHIEEGPMIGKMLEAIREAQAMGEVSSRAAALAFGQKWLEGTEK